MPGPIGEGAPEKIRQLWATWRGWVVLGLAFLVLVVVLVVLALDGTIETGFGEYTPRTSDTQRAKTLWDWMDLLLVPMVLALGAAFFTWVTNKRQRDLESDRSREAALQTYLDRMTELMEKGLRESDLGDPKRSVARAWTITALRQLDGVRKGLLLRFLHESDLIGVAGGSKEKLKGAVFSLVDADLRGADLRRAYLPGVHLRAADLEGAHLDDANLEEANLEGAHLEEANLEGAHLEGAHLEGAHLEGANLEWASLSGADLEGAYLSWAHLSGADLEGAYLRRTHLRGTDLRGAHLYGAHLEGADLSKAKLTPEQLAQTFTLKGATMPDSTEYTTSRTESTPEPQAASEPVSTDPHGHAERRLATYEMNDEGRPVQRRLDARPRAVHKAAGGDGSA